jgi:hypothetical protein
MSVGIVVGLMSPLPIRHSPKQIVLLAPSRRSRKPWVRPLSPTYSKTPLGGPPLCWPANSIVEPTEAKSLFPGASGLVAEIPPSRP